MCVCVYAQLCLTLQPHGLQSARLLCSWDFPVKNTGLGRHFPLRRMYLAQGLKPRLLCLLHWQMDFFSHCATWEAFILRTAFCKWRKLHRDHLHYWSVSFKTHKNFTQYWLYLEIKITLKKSSDFYLIPCGDLWLTTQCLNAVYSPQDLADTTSANRSLFWFNLKDYFFMILLRKWSWKRGFIKGVKEVSKF